MKCREFDGLLCDYLDGTAAFEDHRRVEAHAADCSACAEKLRDAQFALEVIHETPPVEPPPELIRGIIHDTLGAGVPALAGAGGGHGSFGFLRPLLHPFLQPRFAMSLAMAVLSLSMISFHGREVLGALGNDRGGRPALVGGISDGLNQAWATGVELYETAVLFYRLQTEFGEGEVHVAQPAAPEETAPRPPDSPSRGGPSEEQP